MSPRRGTIVIVVAVLCSLSGMPGANGPAGGPPVNEVKTAFLYHFIKFVEWPTTSFELADDTLELCVYGGGPMRAALDSLATKRVNGRSVSVRSVGAAENIAACRVLFIADFSRNKTREVLVRASGEGILTVGDRKDFTQLGGAIGFVVVKQRVRFAVNLGAAQAAGLSISSKLLRLAVRVDQTEASKGG